MPARRLAVYYDYVDPFCYLFEPALRRLEQEEDVEIERLPFELWPPGGRLPDPNAPGLVRVWEERVAPLAERLNLEIRRPRLIPWTRKAHELARHARTKGRFREIHEAIFHAYFGEGRDVGRIDVLVDVGRALGLDATETKVVLDLDAYAELVAEDERTGRLLGVAEVPAIVAGGAGGGRRLVGCQPYDLLAAFVRASEEP
ncbi:MAG: DsbA family protein [Gemmatimonadetes bacterium]|nr:DsbA family protein [Gemmatimonadota bacterium]